MVKMIAPLIVGLFLAVSFTLAAPAADETAETEELASPEGRYREAPMLATLVAQGMLPPIDDRLPDNPLVITQQRNAAPDGALDLQVGKHGGTIRLVHLPPYGTPEMGFIARTPLVTRPGENLAHPVTPNIVESWETNADNTVFTFRLREGHKWSDGAPVTTDDVRFAYEDIFLNEVLSGGIFAGGIRFRSGFKPDGELQMVAVIDAYTFRVVFAEPTPQFIDEMAKPWMDYTRYLQPSHYLKQFHASHISEDELMRQIKEIGLAEKEDWGKMFSTRSARAHGNIYSGPEVIGAPVLWPWVLVEAAPTQGLWERNPYYFMVDTGGQQLPYIDHIQTTKIEDAEAFNLKVINGEVDLALTLPSITSIPLYKEYEQRGGYTTQLINAINNGTTIYLNFGYEDPTWREIVADVRFRRALALAVNSEEIIDSVFYGFGDPPVWVPGEYDPPAAAKLLDQVGLDKRDSEGWRLRPDGTRLELPFEIHDRFPWRVPLTELVVEYLREVGLYTTMKLMPVDLWVKRSRANELQITIRNDESTVTYGLGHVQYFLPAENPLYQKWINTSGAAGLKPHQWWLDIYNLGVKMGPGIPWSDDVFDEYKSRFYEYLPTIPLVDRPKNPVILNSKLGNVFTGSIDQWVVYAAEQLYYME